jgi:polysaccharide biosynthesis protein PslF
VGSVGIWVGQVRDTIERTMQILVICPSFPPATDGEGEHCFQIAERLSAKGHRVQVLTQRRAGLARSTHFETLASMDCWTWRALPALIAALRSSKADACVLIYTARLYDEHPMITFLPTWRRWFAPSARVVSLVEIERPPKFDRRHVRWIRKLFAVLAEGPVDYGYGTLLRGSDCVAVLGPSILTALARQDPAVVNRSIVLPPPPLVVPPLEFSDVQRRQTRTGLGVSQGDLLLGYFGYVYPGKGVETLFTAIPLLLSAGLSVRVLMAGGGRGDPVSEGRDVFEAKLRQIAAASGVSDRILWQEGYTGGTATVAQELLSCDLAVLPFDDGAELRRSSIAVIASLGLPLVTTVPNSDETAFQHQINCWLVPPKDPAALSDAVRLLAEDTVIRARLAAGALELANSWFSWDVVVEGIEAAIAKSESAGAETHNSIRP